LIWLLKDFDLLSVLLRAMTLSLEALTLGGVAFLLFAALPAGAAAGTVQRLRRVASWFALALGISQVLAAATSCAILVGGSGFPFREVMTADFFFWGVLLSLGAFALSLLLRVAAQKRLMWCLPLAAIVLVGSVGMSHAAARVDDRAFLLVLTALHHIGAAAWIGAMPFLLMALRREDDNAVANRIVRRFSNMAILSVVLLVLGGIGMSVAYVGSWQGLYGTTYGTMLLAKIYLLLVVLAMGAGNFFIVREVGRAPASLLMRLRRFSEAEIGLGFTAILAAASLTSAPPAVDLKMDRLTSHEIVQRMRWVEPRLTSPPFAALAPAGEIKAALQESLYVGWENDANDRAWSEYNHHWAGLIVLSAGLLALLARWKQFRWAQNWPLLFIGLAVFIVLRADSENWPLGPRSFWQSFSSPDVLEHRLYAVLITAFAFFEWAVETGRLKAPAFSYVFPLLCAAGGALLMTHSHPLKNLKDSMLVELSHTPIALLGATAGWSRWLELRLPDKRDSKIASYIWPVCLVLVGVVLLDYREA
jgi:copper resistance protein D